MKHDAGTKVSVRPQMIFCLRSVLIALTIAGCGDRGNMRDQPRVEAYEEMPVPSDALHTRTAVPGTVPRDLPRGAWSMDQESPRPQWTSDLVHHGREQFDIYCSVCHGRDGYGNGMVVQRGYPPAQSLHTERLRSVKDRHLFQVITGGFRNMPAYGKQISPTDRWAIVAYVRALQLSQNARTDDVPPTARIELQLREDRSEPQ